MNVKKNRPSVEGLFELNYNYKLKAIILSLPSAFEWLKSIV